MILSNEPGYYKTGAYGIRIENLIVVEPRAIKGAEREMLGFSTLTLAPIDLALIEAKLLTREELVWLNAYHARVRKALSPLVSPPTRRWLASATKAIRTP
jgi:Xaa-Pro aminopeptidase